MKIKPANRLYSIILTLLCCVTSAAVAKTNTPVQVEVSTNLPTVTISVTDARTGKPIPARITITDTNNAPLTFRRSNRSGDVALRRGLVYTRGTATPLDLPPGDYNVYATRGMEWGRASKRISVRPSKPATVSLKIKREVDTTGFIAADTHMHTLTFSGHGDASIEERMLTLAGEGVEMAVATDHNHNIDYRPYQQQMQVTKYFTAVTGNEVSTPVGHINGFPLDPKDERPEFKLTNWVKLVSGIRDKGAKVVILNHPRWPHRGKDPLTGFGFDSGSGEFRQRGGFPFDAMELANTHVSQKEPLYVVYDWFALLNRGHKITGVAASDTHTVASPPGQGRSYVPSRTDDPIRIDVDEACDHFVRGDTTVSVGILADVIVDGRYKMGDTNTLRGKMVRVNLRVATPSWVKPRRAMVFLNGQAVVEQNVSSGFPKHPTNVRIEFELAKPAHDAYLVCVVTGDGVSHPSWTTKDRWTMAATNPIFLDADGDGQYSSPHALALAALQRAGESPDQQWQATTAADDVVAIQMLSLLRERWPEQEQAELVKRVHASGRQALRGYIEPPVRTFSGEPGSFETKRPGAMWSN